MPMLSDEGFEALRVAATLAHSVPWLRLRLRAGAQVVIDVAPILGPDPADGRQRVTPCAFRRAVVEAWQRQQTGERLSFLHLGFDPAIDIGVPPGGSTFPGGIHRVPLPGRHLYVAATTLPFEACQEEAEGYAGALDAPPGASVLGLRADEETGVCLLHVELCEDHLDEGEAVVLELLQELRARVAVRELLDGLAAAAPPR
jgi:hypothetical protein